MTKKRFKTATSWIWNVLVILIITLIAGILIFVILKKRVGGLVHL